MVNFVLKVCGAPAWTWQCHNLHNLFLLFILRPYFSLWCRNVSPFWATSPAYCCVIITGTVTLLSTTPLSWHPSFSSSHLTAKDRIPLLNSLSIYTSFYIAQSAPYLQCTHISSFIYTCITLIWLHTILAELAAFCWCEDPSPASGRSRGDRGHAVADGGARCFGQPQQQLDRQPQQPGDFGGPWAPDVPLQVHYCPLSVLHKLISEMKVCIRRTKIWWKYHLKRGKLAVLYHIKSYDIWHSTE